MMPASKQQNLAQRHIGLVLALVGLMGAATLATGPITESSAQADAPSWSYTGSLTVARSQHTATRLPDGKVLVTGGVDGERSSGINSAELYDPITGLWSVTGSLNVPRSLHTATLLEDGKVLVAGGSTDAAINTAEVYDPVTGLWSLTGNLNVGHYLHTATLRRDGKVLLAGGGDNLNYFATSAAEVYDPATRTWRLTGNLNDRRLDHTATLLASGEVLVAGGAFNVEYDGGLGSAELYDPSTETWRFTGSLNTWRVYHAAVLLPNGDVLVAGGDWLLPSNGASEIYHVANGRWSNNGYSVRYLHTLTLLQNGKALTAGGAIFGLFGPGSTLTDADLYDPDIGSWKKTATLNEPRADHTATLLEDGRVLVVGGFKRWCCGGFLRSAELYGPEMFDPAPRIITASVAGKKLIVTGENFGPGAVIMLNGEEQKTKNNQDQKTRLVAKKAGKLVKAGDRLQVRNPDGTLSEEFIFADSITEGHSVS